MRNILALALAAVAAALAAPAAGQEVSASPPDTSTMAQQVAAAQQMATDAKTAADSAVKSVNGVPATNGAVTVAVPTAATTTPPSVADSSATGTMTTVYALANHTHASKARKGRVLVPVAGFLDVTYSTPFGSSPPICAVTAETTSGDTNVVNAQIDGTPTMNGMRVRITRTAITAVSLLGLNILSVPSQVATWTHYVCLEP